jgi:hypothetical protein
MASEPGRGLLRGGWLVCSSRKRFLAAWCVKKRLTKSTAKKTAIEWAQLDEIIILDPDGFRDNDGVTIETPISYAEYNRRICHATVMMKKNPI